MRSESVSAWFFNGLYAAAIPVRVEGAEDQLLALGTGDEVLVRAEIARVHAAERFVHSPLMLSFPGGAHIQVDDPGEAEAIEAMLARPLSIPRRLQASWPAAAAAVAALIAALIALYFKGIPLLAEWTANAVPQTVEAGIGQEVLKLLDRKLLQPSTQYASEKVAIEQRFRQMAERSVPGLHYKLEFRAARSGSGINAFALPGGTIIVLDGLIRESDYTDQVVAVLAHELGHVALRHPMKRLTQSVGVGVMAGLLWGDISSVAANGPTVLGVLHYSRDAEREADDFALKVLSENGLTALPLIELFETLQKRVGGTRGVLPDFLSTHPSTDERIQRLSNTLAR